MMSNGIPRKLALAAFFLASAYSSAYSTAVYAADEAIQIAEEASESARSSVKQRTVLVDKTARKVTDIRAALMAYYTDKMAWPASLDLLVAGGYYPKADWSTPYGNIAGAINGPSYVLSLTLPNGSRATPIGKLIAAKANGTASGSNKSAGRNRRRMEPIVRKTSIGPDPTPDTAERPRVSWPQI